MKKRIALFAAHLRVCIAKHKTNRGEEVAFARSIAPNNHVMLWRKGLNDSLLLVAITPLSKVASALSVPYSPLEALNDNLLDIHLNRMKRKMKKDRPSINSSLT